MPSVKSNPLRLLLPVLTKDTCAVFQVEGSKLTSTWVGFWWFQKTSTVPSVKFYPLRLLLPDLTKDTCAMSQVVDYQVGGSLMGSEDLNLAIIGH